MQEKVQESKDTNKASKRSPMSRMIDRFDVALPVFKVGDHTTPAVSLLTKLELGLPATDMFVASTWRT